MITAVENAAFVAPFTAATALQKDSVSIVMAVVPSVVILWMRGWSQWAIRN
jgi:hypothetical protein